MKQLLLFISVLLFPFIVTSQSTTEIAKNTIQSTVSIVALDNSLQPLGFGSGFIIDDELIVTNVHVIEGCSSAYILVNGQEKKIKIEGYLAIDKTNDLVILKTSGLNQKSLELGEEEAPEIGEKIYAVGNPKGFNGTFSEGIISGIRDFDNNQVLQITAPISPGSSGGPVLNIDGKVVGVAFASYSEGQNLNFAIPIKYVHKLINNQMSLTPISTIKKPLKSIKTTSINPNIKDGVTIRNIVPCFDDCAPQMVSFSIKNNLPTSISNVRALILVYDNTGTIVDYNENTYINGYGYDQDRPKEIKPFLAKTIDFSQDTEIHGRKGYVVKIRILDFKINEE